MKKFTHTIFQRYHLHFCSFFSLYVCMHFIPVFDSSTVLNLHYNFTLKIKIVFEWNCYAIMQTIRIFMSKMLSFILFYTVFGCTVRIINFVHESYGYLFMVAWTQFMSSNDQEMLVWTDREKNFDRALAIWMRTKKFGQNNIIVATMKTTVQNNQKKGWKQQHSRCIWSEHGRGNTPKTTRKRPQMNSCNA